MAAVDVNQLFTQAEAAFAAGRLDEARRALAAVPRSAVDHEAVHHLRALVEKRGGDAVASEGAFKRALALAPGDPQINNNYANLLDQIGRAESALEHYDRALKADAAFADARFNRALLLQKLGRGEQALAEFDRVLTLDPGSARAHSARGSVLRQLARFAEAAAAYDSALSLSPTHGKALDGRARVALETGHGDASAHFKRALAAQPSSFDLQLGLAEALEAEGNPDALAYLESAVAARPDWIEGHQRLAEMRSEHGEERFTRGYEGALAARPQDRALHYSHWRALALGGRYAEALEAVGSSGLSEDRDMRLMRAIFLSEAGEPDKAVALLEGLGDEPDTVMARARTLLRVGQADRAAALFEQVTAAQPGNIAAWAHLGLAWRLTSDLRHQWLCEQPGLYGTVELDIESAALGRLADVLRGLHRTNAHPIGQSLRGGTQTRGRLFWRSEPEIAALYEAIRGAVASFVAQMPVHDPTHPLLRHRDANFKIEGSWSVRLLQSGFHINHIHPQGALSSACYIALPESLGGVDGKGGWLELGASPVGLDLGLEPIASIEPRPGRLALFPSYLYHGTRPFSAGERLTVAFDVVAR